MRNKIIELLETLKFQGMAMALESQIALAEKGAAAQEIIYNLLREELRFRQERGMQNRLRNAKMPWDWTLNSFPFKKQPDVNKNQIMALSGLDFLQRGENIIFQGKTGVGKSGLAVGILRQALISGFRGKFYDVQHLLDDLYASLADRSTTKLLNALCRYDILLLDELGYLTLNMEQMNAFFKLMKERYEAGKSTIITTNLEPEDWYNLLKPKDMVDALLDRLYHRCVVIKIDGLSLRDASSH
ncbi:MAG TPA: ATP-binding protein [Nitrospirae bacterium]|nr:ATP-binding protein [Nitrospirota bacterium]HDK16798.1 ATP-binding protein [Nitrospirota bacterium]